MGIAGFVVGAVWVVGAEAFVTRSAGTTWVPARQTPASRCTTPSPCTQQQRGMSMRFGQDDPMLKPLTEGDYIAVGLACCYTMNEDNKLNEAYVFEPLTAGTMETIVKGIETSYKRVTAMPCGEYFEGSPADPQGIQEERLKVLLQGESATMCQDMVERSLAAARTFRRRVEAQLIPFGEVADDFNFNTEKKRILNQKYEPSFDDNVKQDKSIDVYGREEEESVNDQIKALENI